MADNGTIFLDEIGELPLNLQVKLLHVVEQNKLIRVGGTKEIPINVRLITATNRDLKQEIEKIISGVICIIVFVLFLLSCRPYVRGK